MYFFSYFRKENLTVSTNRQKYLGETDDNDRINLVMVNMMVGGKLLQLFFLLLSVLSSKVSLKTEFSPEFENNVSTNITVQVI